MGHALRKALGVIAVLQGRGQAAGTAVVAAQAGVPELAACSLKAALDRDWDDPGARDGRWPWCRACRSGWKPSSPARPATRQRPLRWRPPVRSDQDVDLTGPGPALRRGVAGDRRVSVEDPQMRHGRKSRPVLFDGCQRHVLRDPDTGLVPAAGITPASAPEASVTGDIAADLEAAGWRLAELHIDRACLSPELVRDRGPGPATCCKAWRVRNTGGRFAKDQFSIDFETGRLTCPAGAGMPFRPGKTVRFPKGTCAACPLRQRCTTSSTGRSVSIHPGEALLTELRQRQQTPQGREELRERVQVEHALAHVGHWQGRRARYLGTRKNLFDLRRVAVVHNLHIIARQTDSYQLAA
jgi:transposase